MNKRTLIIDRSKWACGGCTLNYLLGHDGKMCCLGFDSHQAGVPLRDLYLLDDPDQAFHTRMPKYLIKKDHYYDAVSNSHFANKAIDINDDADLTHQERERKLKELYKSIGREVKFVGKYNE